jgi:microcystin-dependent protein
MAQPYVGEIRMFGGNFAPVGWMFCEGQLLPISENETLFQLIGTTYGGDGESTFALPDLRGRIPVHMGSNAGSSFTLAETGGAEDITLTVSQIPAHSHPFMGSSVPGTSSAPKDNVPATTTTGFLYINENPGQSMAATATLLTGGSQPHTNFQPYLCVNFIISLFGLFPSPT